MQKIVKSFNQFVNESWDPQDAYEEGMSNCCGSRIMTGDICSDCGEHCESQDDDDYENDDFENDDLENDDFEDENLRMYEAKKSKKAKDEMEEEDEMPKGKKSTAKKPNPFGKKEAPAKKGKEAEEKPFGKKVTGNPFAKKDKAEEKPLFGKKASPASKFPNLKPKAGKFGF